MPPPKAAVAGDPGRLLLLTVQEYAALRLLDQGDVEAAERRHGACFAGFGGKGLLENWVRPAQRRVLWLELDNLVVACRRAVRRGDGETATNTIAAAWHVLQPSGPYAAACELAESVAAHPQGHGRDPQRSRFGRGEAAASHPQQQDDHDDSR